MRDEHEREARQTRGQVGIYALVREQREAIGLELGWGHHRGSLLTEGHVDWSWLGGKHLVSGHHTLQTSI